MRLAVGVVVLFVAVGILATTARNWPVVASGQGGMTMNDMMMQGMGMMGGPYAPSSRPISIERAVEILRQWPDAHHIDGLVLDEVEAYTQNFYGQFKEASTGKGAVQVLVDRYTGRAMPEMGPNMMWNAKYGKVMMQEMMSGSGMMGGGGMMGGASTIPPASAIAEAQAKQSAAQFLSGYLPGATAGKGDAFYGYYHFNVLRGGRQVGMLSVNAQSGQVWYHTWHGVFLDKREIRQ